MKEIKTAIFIFFLIVSVFVISEKTSADSSDNVWGWAWSGNIGWISFNSTDTGSVVDYGVNIETDGVFSGYAWSENIGWIKFDPTTIPPGESSAKPVRLDLTAGGTVCGAQYDVCGWARVCSAVADKATCEGAADPNTGGWDGWIKLRGIYGGGAGIYGVSLNPGTQEFDGWAWGGDDTSAEAVVGWISFSSSTYKVTTDFSFNQPPDKPTTTSTWDNCSFKPSIPIFQWSYNDQDDVPPGTDPQTAYQIRIRDVNNFPVDASGDPVVTADEFKCGSPPQICSGGSSLSFSPVPSDWAGWQNWNDDYWWTVRVKDNNNNWSSWSDSDYFQTPDHAYPQPDFDWNPFKLSVGIKVNLCATVVTSTCDVSLLSVCYDALSNPISCSGKNFNWEIPSNAKFATGSFSYSENPSIIFTDLADENKVKLTITDDVGDCPMEKDLGKVRLPLPEWREVPPIIWLDKFFSSIASTFEKFFNFN